MKVWKSPVLYIGMALILAVLAALAAPYVIDWNSYRADLEAFGRKITGREVRVEGNVTARLFPWPRLTLEDVHIANLPGLEEKEFASAERIDVQMTLAGLFSGTFQVETITIDGPVVTFERNATGTGNWQFQPAAALSSDELLGRVRLDQITLRDGTLRLVDRRRDETIRLDDFNASLAAPDVKGPWRMRATAVHDDRNVEIGLNTGSWKPEEPFRFGLRFANADGSGLAYSFDGSNLGDRLEGTVRIEPAAQREAKADSEGQLRPFVLTSKVNATFEDVAFEEIQISPLDISNGGTVLNGDARLAIGSTLKATVNLTSPRIDLDEIAGAETRTLLRGGEVFALAKRLQAMIPDAFALEGTAQVTSLKAGGQNLENFELEISGDRDSISIRRFRTDLPGRSSVLVEGVYLPGSEGGEFAGTLAAESSDLRLLTSWLWPEGKSEIDRMWTGERGRVKFESEVSLRPSRLRFSKTRYELDGVPGSIDLVVGAEGRRSVDLRVDTELLDADRYMPPGKSPGALSLWPLFKPSATAPDLRLTVQSRGLILNGVEAEDIALDLASGVTGLDLRTIQIGSVEGARLDASGLFIDNGMGPDGSISAEVTADDPRGFLRLAGLLPKDGEPPWAAGLGKTTMRGTLSAKPKDGGSLLAVDIEGETGVLKVAASGSLAGEELLGAVEINAPNGAGLLQLIAQEAVVNDNTPARATLTVSGTRARGFLTDLQVQAFGANLGFNGSTTESRVVEGKITLKAPDASALFAATGLPSTSLPAGVLVLDGTLAGTAETPVKLKVEGRFAATPISAEVSLDGQHRISANLTTGSLLARDVLAATFLDWNGEPPSSETIFAPGLPFGLQGEVWITPSDLRISDIYSARNVQAAINVTGEDVRVAIFGKDETGRDALIEVAASPNGDKGQHAITGKVRLPINLAQHLRMENGEAAASGSGILEVGFQGAGRSPAGALIGLSGSGSFSFENLQISHVDVPAFKRKAAEATDGEALIAAFAALREGGALAFGKASGSVTIVNGVAAFSPVRHASDDAEAELTTMAELGQGSMDSTIKLSIRDSVARPPMEISFSGSPHALHRSDDNAELFSQLGVALMDQGVAELERLRQEQERLAAAEEQARKEDEAKLRDYYAQRDELRLRQREARVHATLRAQAADALRAEIEQSRAANTEINKAELKQRLRELRVHRRLARQAQAILESPPQHKPKPRVDKPAEVPLVLPPPEEPKPVPPSQADVSPSQ